MYFKANYKSSGDKNNFIDYLFWVLFILFTNPGGIQQALGLYDFVGRINLNDFIFVILAGCYLLVPKRNRYKDPLTKKIKRYMIIFFVYFFIVFGYLTPIFKNPDTNVIFNFIKLRFSFYNFGLFFFVLTFWKRSWRIFLKLFIYSSIIILVLFLQSLITGIDVIPREETARGFISLNRNMLLFYGLMPLFTAIGVILLIFKFETKYKKLFIVGFLMINIAWVLSLTRRHILGLFICFFIGYLLYFYIKKHNIKNVVKPLIRSVAVFGCIIIVLRLFFPAYLSAGINSIESAIHVIRYGKDITGKIDERLALFGRYRMVEEFKKSPLFGTGFKNIWRIQEGEELGYESSDYHFQAALAMTGMIGCLMFLPIYIILIKMLFRDLKHLKKSVILPNSLALLMLLSFILWFTYLMLQYINWFGPVSNSGRHTFYILLAFYCGAREIWYSNYGRMRNYYKSNKIKVISYER